MIKGCHDSGSTGHRARCRGEHFTPACDNNSGGDRAKTVQALWIIDKILFAVSLGSCLLVLALTGWIYSVKAARPHLRRVSFRLMLWALMLMVPYSVFKVFLLSDVSNRAALEALTISRSCTGRPRK